MNLWTEKVVERIRAYISGHKDNTPVDSCEILVRSRKTFEVSAELNKGLVNDQRKFEFVSLRLQAEGKVTTVIGNSIDNNDLSLLVENAFHSLQNSQQKREQPFPSFEKPGCAESYLDDTFLLIPNEEKSTRLVNLPNHLKTVDLGDSFKIQGHYREDHWMESLWVTGASRCLSWEKCVGYLHAEAFLEKNGQVFKGTSEIADAVYYGMDWPRVVKEAAIQAQSIAGQLAPVPRKYRVLFSPQVSARLAWYIGQALRGDLVATGQSFLGDSKQFKRGEAQLSNSEFSLVDDPHHKKSVGLAFWDTEGFPTQRHEFISNGVLKLMPQNYKSSLLTQSARTGNAVRSWGQAEPVVGYHNLCVEPGKRDFIDMLRLLGSGIFIVGMDGPESIQIHSGEYLIGCVGYRVENGVEGEAVGKFYIKGNLQDLMRNIAGVGRDIRWYGRVASGSLLCDDIEVVKV